MTRLTKPDTKRRSSKEKRESKLPLPLLSRKDSNLDKQNQNLLCYHYTTRQALPFRDRPKEERTKCSAKIVLRMDSSKARLFAPS